MMRIVIVFVASLIPSLSAAEVPPNGWIVWASNRDGRHEIYRMKADGSEQTRLTTVGAEMPSWSPDGRWVSYRTTSDGTLHVMRWDGSESKQIFSKSPTPGQPASVPPFWMPDNSGVVSADRDNYYLISPDTKQYKKLFSIRDFNNMKNKELIIVSMSPDGRWAFGFSDIYRGGYKGNNGVFNAGYAAVAVDRFRKDDIYFIGDGCEPTLSITGDMIYHVNRQRHISKMKLSDLDTRASYRTEIDYPYKEWGWTYFPRVSNDNKWIAVAGSQKCQDHKVCDYEVAIHKIGADPSSRTRLTFNKANDQWPHLFIGKLWTADNKPRLILSKKQIDLTLGGDSNKKVSIKNSGSGSLPIASSTIKYISGLNWLTVQKDGAGNEQYINLEASARNLADGRYKATVSVMVQGAVDSPQEISVTFNIPEGANRDVGVGEDAGCSCSVNTTESNMGRLLFLFGGLILLHFRFFRRNL